MEFGSDFENPDLQTFRKTGPVSGFAEGSVYLCALGSQGRPPWQDSMMLGHASPVAHLSITIISFTSG